MNEPYWTPPPITPRMLREGADTWPDIVYDKDCDSVERLNLTEWGWKLVKPKAAYRKGATQRQLRLIK